MISTAFLSMWLSNTATTAMMVPIAQAVLMELKQHSKRPEGEPQISQIDSIFSDMSSINNVKFLHCLLLKILLTVLSIYQDQTKLANNLLLQKRACLLMLRRQMELWIKLILLIRNTPNKKFFQC